jgi:hypothetical protein
MSIELTGAQRTELSEPGRFVLAGCYAAALDCFVMGQISCW